jgi:hypothetical protein
MLPTESMADYTDSGEKFLYNGDVDWRGRKMERKRGAGARSGRVLSGRGVTVE